MNQNKFQLSRLLEIYETDSRTFQQSKDYINQYFFSQRKQTIIIGPVQIFKT